MAGPVINNGGKINIKKIKKLSRYIFIIINYIIDYIEYNDINYLSEFKM